MAERQFQVLMTADALGGVWTYCMELAAALAERGVRVALATMGGLPSPFQRRQARAICGLRLFESSFRLEWMPSPWSDVEKAGRWLLEIRRIVQPDIVHLNGYCHASLPWEAPTLVVAHSCVLSWFEAVRSEPAPSTYDRYRAEVSRAIGSAHLVVAPSAAMLREIERHYGAPVQSVVIPNGRALSLPADVRKEPIVLCATRAWDEAKNVQTLARAAAGLPWPVYLAGDVSGPMGESRSIDLAGLRQLGWVDASALSLWLARASIFALPVRYEPFGLSALEAALAGAALVLGDIPSQRELWGDSAVFVTPDDARGLRAAITDLALSDARREALASRARRRAESLSPATMADRYLAVYSSLASAPWRRASVSHEAP